MGAMVRLDFVDWAREKRNYMLEHLLPLSRADWMVQQPQHERKRLRKRQSRSARDDAAAESSDSFEILDEPQAATSRTAIESGMVDWHKRPFAERVNPLEVLEVEFKPCGRVQAMCAVLLVPRARCRHGAV